jgi:hypothetical protein
MLRNTCRLITILCFFLSDPLNAQQGPLTNFTPDPLKVQMYAPYLAAHYGGAEAIENLKLTDKFLYFRELWYYTESFSVVRNYLSEGIVLNEDIIDISRFEIYRKYDEAVIVTLPGFRDALKLVAGKDLLHKPAYLK